MEKVITTRSNLEQDTIPAQFSFSKFQSNWLYIYVSIVTPDTAPEILKKVKAFAVAIIASVRFLRKYFWTTYNCRTSTLKNIFNWELFWAQFITQKPILSFWCNDILLKFENIYCSFIIYLLFFQCLLVVFTRMHPVGLISMQMNMITENLL